VVDIEPQDTTNVKRRQPFTQKEDGQLRAAVESHGDGDWHAVSQLLPGRTPRQCKERWTNYLDPNINMRVWSQAEDLLLLQKHGELGSKWVQLAQFFANRTDGQVKNRFLQLQRRNKRFARMQAVVVNDMWARGRRPLGA
jgi:hypothetical protein